MTSEIDPAESGRPQPARLSRELVLRTALGIIDRDGVAELSMRRLGAALNRDPMSLFRYAKNRAALLDGVAELVLEPLTVDTTDDDWESQLRTVARTYRALALDNPEETDDLLRLGLHRLPIKEFPLLRSLAADLPNHDGEAGLERSLTSCSPAYASPTHSRRDRQARRPTRSTRSNEPLLRRSEVH